MDSATFALLDPLDSKTSHFVDVSGLNWQSTKFAGITMKVLYSNVETGISTIMFKMAPGSEVPLHEHTALEQTFVLEGSLVDDDGAVTAGNYVWRPAGNTHVAKAPHGAVFLSFFLAPNKFASGQAFFTTNRDA